MPEGWGADVINESGTADLTDVIQFSDVASTEVSFERRGDALILKRGTSGDQLTVNGFFTYYSATTPPAQVEQFRFTDTTLTPTTVISRAITYGTTAADYLSAYYVPAGQTAYLGDGNDSFQGSQFVDTILGEAGDDSLQGYAGNDTIDGGLGNDSLYAGDGNDTLRGGDGNDTVSAGTGNDIITGGIGNDTLSGETGNDTYLFARGWGADVINESGTADLTDVIQFTDVASTEVSFERRGDALILKRGTSGDQLTVNGFFTYYSATTPPAQVEQFRFTDTTLTPTTVISRAITYGTTAADYLSAYYVPAGQTAYLGDGNDSFQGSQFVDTILGEAGDDSLQGYAGNDTIDGGLGNDSLYAGDGNDTLRGGDGNDTVSAGTGNDIITGGIGNDTLSGETGNDTYLFARGWGADVINESGTADLTDVIQFTDVASTEVSFERRGDALILKRGTSGDQLTVNGFFTYYSATTPPAQVEQFRFTDTTLTPTTVIGRAITYGTTAADYLSAYYVPAGQTAYLGDGNDSFQGSQFVDTILGEAGDDSLQGYAGNDTIDGGLGNDSLYAGDGNDTLRGGDGNDTVSAGTGNDIITGGIGNDTLSGETGNDTYLFARGWGADVINESGTADLTDVIQFTDVASTEVSFERRGDALILKRGTSGDQLTVNGFFTYYSATTPPAQVEQFRFTDTTLTPTTVIGRAITYGTTAADYLSAYYVPAGQTAYLGDGNDSFQGSQFVDTILGEAGDDSLQGYAGNDTIDGGLGNDSLYAGDGNDTLRGGDGNDTLTDSDGVNVYIGGAGSEC